MMLGCELVLGTVVFSKTINRTAEIQRRGNVFPVTYAEPFRQWVPEASVLKAVDMTDFIKTDFSSVPSVRDVEVKRRGNDFEVNVFLANFERTLRRMVYAKEKALHREFPEYLFDFNLVDVSGQNDVLNSAVSS